jgi:hypothetical protein
MRKLCEYSTWKASGPIGFLRWLLERVTDSVAGELLLVAAPQYLTVSVLFRRESSTSSAANFI